MQVFKPAVNIGIHMGEAVNPQEKNNEVIEMVTKTPSSLRHVVNKTPEICRIAVNLDSHCIVFLDHTIPNIIDEANPDHQFYHGLGWRNGDRHAIELLAVQKNSETLQHIKNPSPAIYSTAFKVSGGYLRYLRDNPPDMESPDWKGVSLEDLYLEALATDERAIDYIDNPSLTVRMAVVTANGWMLSKIKQQTPEICMAAVSHEGLALQFVREQTLEICLTAINNNLDAIKHVKDLESVALHLSDEIIQKGLSYTKGTTLESILKVIKIRESHAIASKINEEIKCDPIKNTHQKRIRF